MEDVVMESFTTGSVRSQQEGRGRFDLIPYEGILALAKRFEDGAKVYGEHNWSKGQPLSRMLSSMRRHAFQIGHDDLEDHAAAVAWNAIAFIAIRERIKAGELPKELDDL